jgi:hypothetical protein
MQNVKERAQGSSIKSFAFSLLALTLFVGTLEGFARFYEFFSSTQKAPFDAGFSRDRRIFLPDTGKPGTLGTNPNKLLSFRKQSFQKQLSPGRFRILVRVAVNYLVNGKIDALQRARKNRLASGSPDVARAWKFNFSWMMSKIEWPLLKEI